MLITSLQFRFRKQRTNADGSKIYWVCTKGSCPARLTTDDNYNFMSSVNSHNHSETVQETDRKVVNAKMKDLAKSGKFLGQPMALVGEALKDLSEESQAVLPKLDHLRRNIHNWQTESLPSLPTSRTGFEIPAEYQQIECKTGDGEVISQKFLQYDSGQDDPDRILVFGTDRAVGCLKNYKHWLSDGTFKAAPDTFYQMYCFHATIDEGFSIPCLYTLLPNKTHDTYKRLIKVIKTLLKQHGTEDIAPESVMCDFELAFITAIQEEFPGVIITLCNFHLGKNVYAQGQKKVKDFQHQYANKPDFNIVCRCLSALAYIPVEDVIDCFEELCENELLPDELVQYFLKNYIGELRGRGQNKKRMAPRFPITLWNVVWRLEMRLPCTNNPCEGFHNGFNKLLNGPHPNLWHLISAMKKSYTLTRKKFIDYEKGCETSRKKYRTATDHLITIVSRYDEGKKMETLKKVAEQLKNFAPSSVAVELDEDSDTE